MSELITIEDWLDDTLTADAGVMGIATGVFGELAPSGQTYPFVVYRLLVPADVRGVGVDARIMVRGTYNVFGVAQTANAGALGPLATAIDQAITTSVGSGGVFTCVRTEPFKQAFVENGKPYRHLGGAYVIEASAA